MSACRRFAVAILLSLGLHAALVSLLPWRGEEKPRERTIMRVSLRAAQPTSQPPAVPSPKPAPAPRPLPPKTETEPPTPRTTTPIKPVSKPEKTATREPRQEKTETETTVRDTNEPLREEPGAAQGTEPDSPAGSSDGNAASQGTPGVVDVESLVVTKKILPDYPLISRKRRDQGTVALLIEIEDGRVSSARVERSSGHAPLDEAALRAVRGWQFDTSKHAGKITARVPITFSLTK